MTGMCAEEGIGSYRKPIDATMQIWWKQAENTGWELLFIFARRAE